MNPTGDQKFSRIFLVFAVYFLFITYDLSSHSTLWPI